MAGYGLRPVGKGGTTITDYDSGGFWEYPIVDGSAIKFYNGDTVELGTDGYAIRAGGAAGQSPTSVDGFRPIGVAVGFKYTNSSSTPVWSQWYDGNAANTNISVMCSDDPNQIFMIRSSGDTTFADVGFNAELATTNVTDANDINGVSGITLNDATIAATATFGLRIVGNANQEATTATTRDVLVRFNHGTHATTNPTGTTAEA